MSGTQAISQIPVAPQLADGEIGFDTGFLRITAGGRLVLAENRVVGVSPVGGIYLLSEPALMSNVFDDELAARFVQLLGNQGIIHHRVPLRMKTSWFGSNDQLSSAAWRRALVHWVRAFFGTVPAPLPGLLPLHEVWCVARLLVWRRQWQAVRRIVCSMAKLGLLTTIGTSLSEAARRWEFQTARSVRQAQHGEVCDAWVRSEIAQSDRLVVSTMTEYRPEYEFSAVTLARLL